MQDNAPPARANRDEIQSVLDRALACIGQLWSADTPVVRRLDELRHRLETEQFQLAVLGQFKRGKSTFLNALLEVQLLPTGVVPVTAIPTFIRWARKPRITVWFRDGREPENFQPTDENDAQSRLAAYVTEDGNPCNYLEVARVEVRYPADILSGGVVLIDTPGIGSTHRHNTQAALDVLPECDGAVFVTSADPPITEAEIEYLATIRTSVANLVFILNKIDYLERDERAKAAEFLRAVLSRAIPNLPVQIFPLSALSAAKAGQAHDTVAFAQSGLRQFQDYLVCYLAHKKQEVLRAAVIKKALRVLDESADAAALRARALEMPIEDFDTRQHSFEEALRRFERETNSTQDLLNGEQKRLIMHLEEYCEALRKRAFDAMSAALDRALERAASGAEQRSVSEAADCLLPAFFEHEMKAAVDLFGTALDGIFENYSSHVEALVDGVQRTAAQIFQMQFHPAESPEPFHIRLDQYWVTQKWAVAVMPHPARLVDWFLAARIRRARLRSALEEDARDLVLRNVENVRWAILQAVQDSFRAFGGAVEERLREATELTSGAIQVGSEKRRESAEVVQAGIAALRQSTDELESLRSALQRLDVRTPEVTAP